MFYAGVVRTLLAFGFVGTLTGANFAYAGHNEINEIQDVTIYGAYDLDKAGWDFASGDFDGDGSKDLAIVSYGASGGSGAITVLWGPASLDSLVDLRHQPNASVIFGPNSQAGTLMSMAVGDLNNDDIDDLVFGFPLARTGNHPGVVYVLYGSVVFPDSIWLDAVSIPATIVSGPAASNGMLGYAVCTGDLNGDNYSDLVMSAPNYLQTGELYVIFGADSLPPSIQTDEHLESGLRVIAVDSGEFTGGSIACGDVNNDGYDELVIGSPGSLTPYTTGSAFILSGASVFPDTILLDDTSAKVSVVLPDPVYVKNALGWIVATSDFNGDDFADVVLTDPGADPRGCYGCGEIYVLYGGQSLPDTIVVNDTSLTITRLIGGGESEGYGANIACGDVSGDGLGDLIILNDNTYTYGVDQNELIIFLGNISPVDSVFLPEDSSLTRIFGKDTDDKFGYGLNVLNVDNDSFADLVVGAYRADPLGRHAAGKAYVVYGPDSSVLATRRVNQPPFYLRQNYPNPFSEITSIEYVLPAGSEVTIAVYNVRGQLVYSSTQSRRPAGVNVFQWTGVDRTGRRAPSGIYFYRVEIPGQAALTRKAVLLR